MILMIVWSMMAITIALIILSSVCSIWLGNGDVALSSGVDDSGNINRFDDPRRWRGHGLTYAAYVLRMHRSIICTG